MKRPSQSGSPRGDAHGPRRDARGQHSSEARGPRRGDARGPRRDESRGPRRDEAIARPKPARTNQRPSPGAGQRPPSRTASPDALLARQPWSSLRPLIPGAEAEIEARLASLRQYAKRLLEWNHGVSNLISHNDEPRLVERHLAESLVPAKALAEFGVRRFVDFGSGAGLPAVPLSLCGIGEHWTLVESRRNKTLFLRRLQQDKLLVRGEVITGRLEVLVEEDARRLACDGFTSRATAAIGPTLELAGRIVTGGGRAFLWKGSSYEEEMAAAEAAWARDWRLERVVPVGNGPNVVAIFIKI